jgi:hypothetical protein
MLGATSVPGKIGMAMAGQGLTASPPPRLAYHSSFGQNPNSQLYVGNMRVSTSSLSIRASVFCSFPIKRGQKRITRVLVYTHRHQYRGRWLTYSSTVIFEMARMLNKTISARRSI